MNRKCRTCLQPVSALNYVIVDDSARQIRTEITACIPELSIDLIKNPIMCLICVNTLHMAYDFKTQCLRSEECIQNQVNKQNANGCLMPVSEIYSLSINAKEEPIISENQVHSLRLIADELNDLLDDALQVEEELSHISTTTNKAKAKRKIFKECKKPNAQVVQPKEAGESNNYNQTTSDCTVQLSILPKRMLYKQVFVCPFCKYATGVNNHFIKHRISHVDKNPFKCDKCSYKFKWRSSLHRHKMKIHNDFCGRVQ